MHELEEEENETEKKAVVEDGNVDGKESSEVVLTVDETSAGDDQPVTKNSKDLSLDAKKRLLVCAIDDNPYLSNDHLEQLVDDVGSDFLTEEQQVKLDKRLESIAAKRYDDEASRRGSVSRISQSKAKEIAEAMGYSVNDADPDIVMTPSGSVFAGDGALSMATGVAIDDEDAMDNFDEEDCSRCVLLRKPVVGKNDGGACCSDCFVNGSFDFKSTIYHMNDEHHSCGPDFPASEAALLVEAGHTEEAERLQAEWRHVHAVWHKNHPKDKDKSMCPEGDHELCQPEYGFGCTAEEEEARVYIEDHNMDFHERCPEDFPMYGMRTADGEPFTAEQVDLVCALWRHSHNRHEFCRAYVEMGFAEFECSLEVCEADEAQWANEVRLREAAMGPVEPLQLASPAVMTDMGL
jgi:hypothetical protein